MTGVADIVMEEYRNTMLHDDMILDILTAYGQSIEESKVKRMARSLKRSGANDQVQKRFENRAQTQEEAKRVNVKLEKEGGS